MAKTTEGEVTIIQAATSNSKSLRVTIPISIVRQFKLSESDRLEWHIEIIDGKLGIVVKPLKK